MQRMTEKRKTE